MGSRKVHGSKKEQNKERRTDLLQILTTLYPQKIVTKRRTKVNNMKNKHCRIYLEDAETSSQLSLESSSKDYSDHDSLKCITSFVIPGNIPDIDSLMGDNELLVDFFLDLPEF